MAKKTMSMEEMLEYIKQYDGMVFKNMKTGEINKHTETYNKIWALLEKFGFKLVRLQRNVVKFRYQLENYDFIDVIISYKEVPGKLVARCWLPYYMYVIFNTKVDNI